LTFFDFGVSASEAAVFVGIVNVSQDTKLWENYRQPISFFRHIVPRNSGIQMVDYVLG